jgi:hypothetical protein
MILSLPIKAREFTNNPMDTPSQALASKILDRLIQEKLISQATAKKMHSKLAEGKIRVEDWRFSIEQNEKGEPQS